MRLEVQPSRGAVRTRAVEVLWKEAAIWLPCAALTFVAASVLITGWPAGLVPNLSYPDNYSGDALSASWVIQNLLEGNWIFHTDRSGYPFGSDLLDYPMSDWGSFAILRLLGLLTGSYWGAMNLYFLLGFPVAFVASFVVSRLMRVSVAPAAAGSILFALLPYHFQRLQHLFLTWYFVVPIFFLFAWRIYDADARWNLTARSSIGHAVALAASASFGIYYALFGSIVLILGGLGGWLRRRARRTLAVTVAAVALTTAGVGLNIAPNMVHAVASGQNRELAHRELDQSESFGLKLVQLLLPRPDHRVSAMGDVTRRYDVIAPLVNENATATLGVVGAAGLVLLGAIVCRRLTGCGADERLAFLALIVVGIFAIATIGGLSSLFATLISPQIRGWNRTSVFVAFAALAAAMIALESLLARHVAAAWLAPTLAMAALLVTAVGTFDQTAPACTACNQGIRSAFERDREFVGAIEASLPDGAAIYQLPYMAFPEAPNLNHLLNYDLAVGVLNSKRLRWSYASIKGREGDAFFRALAKEPLAAQIAVLGRLNFSGIYVDRRGFADGGRAIENELRRLTGAAPQLVRADGQVAFYKLSPATAPLPAGLGASRIQQLAGFTPGPDPSRYAATLAAGMDLRKDGLPDFVEDIQGLAAAEPWGRWSDSNLRRDIVIKLREPLPNSFTLALRGQAYGPNAGKPVSIRIGRETRTITLPPEMAERRVRFDLEGRVEQEIRIRPPVPAAPIDLLVSDDVRRLGIGLERIWFEK